MQCSENVDCIAIICVYQDFRALFGLCLNVLKGGKNTKGFKEKDDIGRGVNRGRSIVTIL
jgi:hypothetical protein